MFTVLEVEIAFNIIIHYRSMLIYYRIVFVFFYDMIITEILG